MRRTNLHQRGLVGDTSIERVRATLPEAASGRPIGGGRHCAGNRGETLLLRAEAGHGGQQPFGVGMRGPRKERLDRCLFNHAAGVHDDDARGHFGHDTKIVRDEQQGHATLGAHLTQQLEDLRLNGDVERRGWFVRNHELRVHDEGHRNHHALTHAAGELVRILPGTHRWIGNADLRQHVDRALPRLPFRYRGVHPDHFGDLIANGQHGIQRRAGFLKDHRDVLSADPTQWLIGEREEVLATESNHAPGFDAARRRNESKQRQGRDRLAATGLADQADCFTGFDAEADPVHRPRGAAVGRPEEDAQRLHAEQRLVAQRLGVGRRLLMGGSHAGTFYGV